jgi:hypothetical protein
LFAVDNENSVWLAGVVNLIQYFFVRNPSSFSDICAFFSWFGINKLRRNITKDFISGDFLFGKNAFALNFALFSEKKSFI